MSFESSGFPLAVCAPEITQLFEPGVQSRAGIEVSLDRADRSPEIRSGHYACDGPFVIIVVADRERLRDAAGSGRAVRPSADGHATIQPDTGRIRAWGCSVAAAMRSRDSFEYQCVSSMSTIIMPIEIESTPVHGFGL